VVQLLDPLDDLAADWPLLERAARIVADAQRD